MKKQILVALTLIASAMVTFGARIPGKSFPISELEKAKTTAQERGKPLIFIDT